MESIGRYEVVRRLGAGGFATVYLVRDPVLDSEVAAKVLADNWSDKVDIRDRFIREAQLLRRIDSDRVVTVHDIGELPSGQPYFVMAYLDRGTLDERLGTNPATQPNDIHAIGTELGECVGVIHHSGMIHRDIKPSNLLIAGPKSAISPIPAEGATQIGFLADGERLVLGDFGLAKDIDLQNTVGFTISAGTGGYAAPEQMSPSGVPDRTTDLYAATGVMYRVVTGRTPPPFDLASETVPFPNDDPAMGGPLGHFFARGMAFHAQYRYPSVEEWLNDFVAGVEGHGSAPMASGETIAVADPNSDPNMVPSGTVDPSSWAPPTGGSPSAVGPSPAGNVPAASNYGSTTGPSGLAPPHDQGAHQYPQTVANQHTARYQQPPSHQPYPQESQPPPHGQYAPAGQAPSPYPHSGEVDRVDGRPKTALVAGVAVLAILALAVIGGWFALRSGGPSIDGPDTVVAGNTALFTASSGDASQFEWTDWNGDSVVSPSFEVTGVAPGSLTFSVAAVEADGSRSSSSSHTISITEAPDGPSIEGPATVAVGETVTYTWSGPDGASNPTWIDAAGQYTGTEYQLTAQGAGSFIVQLVLDYPDGRRVGTTRTIELTG